MLLTSAGFLQGDVAASAWLCRTWQTEEGLPDNNVTALAQSSDGYIWVATLAGLLRFDGAGFEALSTVHLPKVASRGVRQLLLGQQGRVWIAGDRGVLIRVDSNSARVFSEEDGLNPSRVTTLVDDRSGTLWLVCGSAAYRIRQDTVEHLGVESELPAGAGTWLATDALGQIWLSRAAELGVIRSNRWHGLHRFETGPLRLFPAHNGGLWVCSGTQVFKFREGGQPQLVTLLPDAVTPRMLLEDRTGALWLRESPNSLAALK